MKNVLSVLIVILVFSCSESPRQEIEIADFTSQLGLDELYKSDQSDRNVDVIDWDLLSARDKQRRTRVYELLDSNKVISSKDFANAAMIFQHGKDTIASGLAVKFMKKAVDLDSTASKLLLAKAIDRDLMFRDKPQIYGTQYTKSREDDPWRMYELDPTKVSDDERREYGVEILAEQKEKLREMNAE